MIVRPPQLHQRHLCPVVRFNADDEVQALMILSQEKPFPKSGFDKNHPINLDSDEEEKATSPTGLKPVTCSSINDVDVDHLAHMEECQFASIQMMRSNPDYSLAG